MKTLEEQIVILLNILPDDCNVGYNNFGGQILKKVNGQAIINMKDLIARIEANKEKYLTLKFDQGVVVVLDTEQAKAATARILTNYRIPSTKSADL